MSQPQMQMFFSISLAALLLVGGCSSSNSDNREEDAPDDVIGNVNNDSSTSDVSQLSSLAPLEINSANFEALARQGVEAINLVRLEQERAQAFDLLAAIDEAGFEVVEGGDAFEGLTLMSQTQEEISDFATDYLQSYTCDEGGFLSLRVRDLGDAPVVDRLVNFDSCVLNDSLYNGRIESFDARRSDSTMSFAEYSRITEDALSITGKFIRPYIPITGMQRIVWENTTFSYVDSTGNVRISNLNSRITGNDSQLTIPGNSSESANGFVLLADGTSAGVARQNYEAQLTSSFELISFVTQGEPVQINVELDYSSSYYDWEGTSETGFDVPTCPITDLGDTLDIYATADLTDEAPRVVELLPQDPAPQWQSGSIRMTDLNNGLLVMQPDPEQSENVLFEINASGEQIVRQWADGFQVSCPSNVIGCGGVTQ